MRLGWAGPASLNWAGWFELELARAKDQLRRRLILGVMEEFCIDLMIL